MNDNPVLKGHSRLGRRRRSSLKVIDTDAFSRSLRQRCVDVYGKTILIARIAGSKQEQDLTVPVNCDGYGRIRHFRYRQHLEWSPDPLPGQPAAKALSKPLETTLRAQVFQNAACNWRCWYCFVDFNRLSADPAHAAFFTADQLLKMYLDQENPPEVIDISGGQPDLTPEWILWTMEALARLDLVGKVFLWNDDNLSNYYLWEFLSREQIEYMVGFPKYSRVGCFKGFDPVSFSFNTCAHPDLFDRQFDIFKRLLLEGFDIYAYVTFTSNPDAQMQSKMGRFIDRLQEIHPHLPLRTVPLKVHAFTPTAARTGAEREAAMRFQQEVHDAWVEHLAKRYSPEERSIPISDVSLS